MMYKEKLKSLGIPISSKGCLYLNDAIQMYKPGMSLKEITLELAKKYRATDKGISRAMYHAIEKTAYFRKMGVKEFIGMIKHDLLKI